MRVVVDVANGDIACASAAVCFLEQNLTIRWLVGIKIGVVDSLVVCVVADNKHFTFPIQVVICQTDMAVWREPGGRCDGFVDGDGVKRRVGATHNVDIIDGVAANQLLKCIA